MTFCGTQTSAGLLSTVRKDTLATKQKLRTRRCNSAKNMRLTQQIMRCCFPLREHSTNTGLRRNCYTDRHFSYLTQ